MAGGSSCNDIVLTSFATMWSIGVGGNLPVDSAIFLGDTDYNLNKASLTSHMWDPRFSTCWIHGGNHTTWMKGNSFNLYEHISPNFHYLQPTNQ